MEQTVSVSTSTLSVDIEASQDINAMNAEALAGTPVSEPTVNPETEQAETKEENKTEEATSEEKSEGDEVAEGSESAESGFKSHLETENAVKEDLVAKGVDFDALAAEYDKNGELSEASLKTLEGAGYPKQMVDAYISNLETKVQHFVGEVHKLAGGEAEFTKLATFMKGQDNQSIEAFNAAINSGSLAQIKLVVDGVKARMTTAYGTANPTIMGQQKAASIQPYGSLQEMVNDMKDPRYQTDAAYTRSIYDRARISKI